MTWRDGALLIGSGSGLWRIFEDGSPPVAVVSDDERALMFPVQLPDGRIVYTPGQLAGRQIQYPMEIYDPADQRSRELGIEGIGAHILSSGHLVWLQDGKLRATRWQDDDTEVQAGVAVLELDVEQSWASVPFALSRAGTLVSARESELQLTWVRKSGEKVVLPVETGFLRHPRWSPDGTRLAVTHGGVGSAHVLIVEVASGRISRLTESGVTVFPKWTWDDRIVFLDPLASAIMVAPWDRSESPKTLWEVPGEGFPGTPETVSPSGVVLFDGVPDFRRLNIDLPGESEPWLETQADELNISFSPDGRWVAYDSNESGRFQVYLRQFEGSTAAHIVSTDGGWSPAWSGSGQELYFGSERGLKVVDVKIDGDSIDLGPPRLVEKAKGLSIDTDRNYDPHPAGDGFVVVEPAGATEFTVITNFESLVERMLSGDEGD